MVFLVTYFFSLIISYHIMVFPLSDQNNLHKLASEFEVISNGTVSSSYSKLNSRRRYVEESVLCLECRQTPINDKMTCGQAIERYVATNNISFEKYDISMITKGMPACREACQRPCDKILWRMDDIAPPQRYGKTYFLSSIPRQHRIPKGVLNSLDDYFAKKEHIYPQRTYFFEYNPSIVKIPSGFDIPERLSESAAYLASFRVSTTQQCVTGTTELTMFGGSFPFPPDNNALGVALLRKDLTVLADVSVNVKSIDKNVQDYRVFAFDNQIYLSSHFFIRPLWLVEPPKSDDLQVIRLDHKFAVSGQPFDVYIRSFPSCARYKKGKRNGKNLNFFKDTVTDQVMMEVFPMGPKIRIDLDMPCEHDGEIQDLLISPQSEPLPQPTYRTIEEKYFGDALLFLERERGSACCVPFPDPRGISAFPLLLGISHTKTLKGPGDGFGNQYVSRFYAVESVSPYRVVAQTGRFCFGFPGETEGDNPYGRLTNLTKIFVGEQLDCPRIHFVSGMIEKADDPSQLLIGYGVNDCAPRIVQVDKDYVMMLLFPTGDVRLTSKNWL